MDSHCIYMSRFFIKDEDIFGDNIFIYNSEDINHIKNVLRCNIDDTLILNNGKCIDFFVKINDFRKDQILTKIINISESKTESTLNIILFQGIPKGDKIDFIIQKSVELGVKEIVPVITKRTIVRLNDEKDKIKKNYRWQKIALEAAKQCNRGIIPKVDMPKTIAEILKSFIDLDLILIPYEKEKKLKLKALIDCIKTEKLQVKTIGVIIGPEGGFQEDEFNEICKYGAKSVTLGPRILRTETAALMILSVLMYEFGSN
jgi:16S rRNA (uracil1498-N3)-methyltransferase